MDSTYNDIVRLVIASTDVAKMHILSDANSHIFELLQASHPDIAAKWLDMLEPLRWHNYLSEDEAKCVVANMSSEGTRGEIISMDTIAQLVGDCAESMPNYNRWALYAVVNMMMHDHHQSLMTIAGDKAPAVALEMSREWLTDWDKPDKLRWYVGL